jgi:anaerobic magnesium-protoporphyrin IX monomethyl ester cyclase
MQKKTLLLVVPPQAGLLEGFSAGIIALGNYIRLYNDDTDVMFVDLGSIPPSLISEYVRQTLQGRSGSVFAGITGTTASYQNMLRTAEAFKKCDPDVITIFGGHHATAQDDVILRRHPCVDFVVRGEGEVALSNLLAHHREPVRVPNLSFRVGDKIERTTDAPMLDESILDRLDPMLGADELLSPPGKFNRVTYVSARGCPLKCSFCTVRNSAIRAKSVPAVIEDLRRLVCQRGYKRIAIEDNFFAHHPRRTIELCAEIGKLQEEVKFYWDCQTRVESVRRGEIIEAMAAANCDRINLGVESLVAEHLKFLGKTPKPDGYLKILFRESIPNIANAGIEANINLQLGIPGENKSHRKTTLKRLVRLGKIAQKYKREIIVNPQLHVIYPGTPHFEKFVADGAFGSLGKDVFEEFTLWEEQEQPILNYFGKHFAHGVGGIPIGILDLGALKSAKFKIKKDAITIFSTQLSDMEKIPGIVVFKYGEYLTKATAILSPALAA